MYYIRFLVLVIYKTLRAQNKKTYRRCLFFKKEDTQGQGSFLGNTGFFASHSHKLSKEERVPCPVVLRGNFSGPTLASQLLKLQFVLTTF